LPCMAGPFFSPAGVGCQIRSGLSEDGPLQNALPVTPAHAADAWPLSRMLGPLPISGLAIGSMAPDFEYLLRLAVYSRIGHTAAGLVVFAIPLAFIVWLVFSRVVRPSLVELLPPGLARAMRPPVQSLALGLAAVTVGALSHIVWDGVTHRRGWTPAILPVLLTETVAGLPLYRLLQHLSSAVGAVAIFIWVLRWVRRQPAEARRFAPGQLRRSATVVATLLAVATLAGLVNAATRQPVRNIGDWLALFVVGAMAPDAAAGERRVDGATISACPD